MVQKISANNALQKTLKVLYKALPVIMFIAYPALILYLCIIQDYRIIKTVFVPAVVFLGVSIFRVLYKSQRPYEKYNIKPLIPKNKKGKSMPSRHTASAFIIAMSFLYINFWLGICTLVVALLIGATRVLCGVHFIKDVAAGAVISILCGVIGFWII